MPSAPKFRYSSGNVWVVKVFQEIKSEHFAKADCHIGITAEVKVNLQSVADNANPVGEDRNFAVSHGKDGGVNCA